MADIDALLGKPLSKHEFVYDSATEQLEPVYFFILDLMSDMGLQPEKLADSFSATPGSGHFSDIGQRATVMQQQGGKILGDVNTVLRSVLNLIYDLKEFRVRLKSYADLKTDKKEAAMLSLKQLWIDRVDINKGNSSIKAMALGQAGFQTLLHAFLFVNELKDVESVDLNESVKRILRARVLEFRDWLENSEKELRKRYELEKTYLKSQVNSLNLYARWAKPYLRAAKDLEMKDGSKDAALVNTFSTTRLELTLFGKKKIDVKEKIASGVLPRDFEKLKTRNYYLCVLVDFNFRAIPQRITQRNDFSFGGRAEITFQSFALNDDELKKFEEDLKKSEEEDVLNLIEGVAGENLQHIQDEINFFLEDKDVETVERTQDTSNPFKALFGFYSSNKKEVKEEKKEEKKDKKPVIVRPESYAEREHLRVLAVGEAKKMATKLFDTYKKSHGMPTFPSK